MPAPNQSEAIVLRTWTFGEADLMVAFFTREYGVLRGVARHAMRSRRRFGGALEPMTYTRATWAERPKQDVVRLDRLEILWSPLSDPVDYPRAAGLAFLAEVLENALPDRAPEDDLFRLAMAVAPQMLGNSIPLAATYFALWTTRLMGWMPELNTCAISGAPLHGEPVYYSPLRDGVTNARSRVNGSTILPADAVTLATRILRQPLPALLHEQMPWNSAGHLRRFAVSTLERHLEERLRSARALAAL